MHTPRAHGLWTGNHHAVKQLSLTIPYQPAAAMTSNPTFTAGILCSQVAQDKSHPPGGTEDNSYLSKASEKDVINIG